MIFTMERIEAANAWAIAAPPSWLTRLLPGAIGWRPTPEGVALVADDRRTLVVFTAGEGKQNGSATIGGEPATSRRR